MPRVISVFLPTLSTDRVRRKAGATAPPPETPLILVGRDGRRRVVLAADAAAQTAGLRVGMPASKAQALVQGLVIQDADPIADAEALERLAFWMLQRFAPIVAANPPDEIVIDSTGADHLHGGEATALAILVEKLAGVGLRARGHRRHLGRSLCPCALRCAAWMGIGTGKRCTGRRAIAARSAAAGVRYGPRPSCPRF